MIYLSLFPNRDLMIELVWGEEEVLVWRFGRIKDAETVKNMVSSLMKVERIPCCMLRGYKSWLTPLLNRARLAERVTEGSS